MALFCTSCGRSKQKKNLLNGVCRTCRRAALGERIFASSNPMTEWANAQPEGQSVWAPGDDAPSLQAFEGLHHMTQTKVIRALNVPWTPGEDRVVAYRTYLTASQDDVSVSGHDNSDSAQRESTEVSG